MNFSEHSRAGLIASVVTFGGGLVIISKFDQPFVWALIVYIGSIFPDLDTDSIPARWAARIGLGFSLIMMILKKPWPPAIVGALFLLIKSGKHRGFIHKWGFPSAFLINGFIWSQPLCFAFGAGLVVHFMVDNISPLSLKNWW